MARSVFVRLTCDRCGGEPAETARLGFEGEERDVDLCAVHRDDLLALLSVSRPADEPLPEATAMPVQSAPAKSAPNKFAPRARAASRPGIAAWAKTHPIFAYKMGRMPLWIEDAYDKFFPDAPPEDFTRPVLAHVCRTCGQSFGSKTSMYEHRKVHASSADASEVAQPLPYPDEPAKTWGTPVAKKPKPQPRPEPTTVRPAARQLDLWPTKSSIADLTRLSLSWPDVCAEIGRSFAVRPSARPDVMQHYTPKLLALVSRDGHVIGIEPRGDVEPSSELVESAPSKIERKGKRGGIGNTKPRTTQEIIDLVESRPGWSWEIVANGHIRVHGPDGQSAQIARTPSDYRTGRNDFARLRRIGLGETG